MAAEQTIHLQLTRAEALVLFDWLARMGSAGIARIDDLAEERVLWRLEGQLESKLTEPLQSNYKDTVEAARREVGGSQA